VNVLACSALAVCAGDRETPRRVAEEVARARETLETALAELPGVRLWPSAANFLLVRVPEGPAVRTALLERGIAVRRPIPSRDWAGTTCGSPSGGRPRTRSCSRPSGRCSGEPSAAG
jgi:histidinol-phosphate/aromatic aminotransferase/cobyric acid decarboxylase-like protein